MALGLWRRRAIHAGYVLAGIVILNAAIASLFSLLSAWIERHHDWFEQAAGSVLHQKVTLQHLTAGWDELHFSPFLKVSQLTLADPFQPGGQLHIREIRIWPAVWRSLLHRRFETDRMRVRGMELAFPFPVLAGGGIALPVPPALPAWFFSVPHLLLADIEVRLLRHGAWREIHIDQVKLVHQGHHHTLQADALLIQENPAPLAAALTWEDDAASRPLAGQAVISTEGILLTEWLGPLSLQNMRLSVGPGNVIVWATLRGSQWQEIQGKAEFYQIVLSSRETGRESLFSGLAGHVGWRRTVGGEEWAGADILVDAPGHYWPVTHFDIRHTRGPFSRITLNTGYFHYEDMTGLADSLLPVDLKKTLQSAKLQAEADSLQVTVQENAGHLAVAGHSLQLTLAKIFALPLRLKTFGTTVDWKKNGDGALQFFLSQAEIKSAEGSASVHGKVIIPKKGAVWVDLAGQFELLKGSDISHWLPLHYFQPGLSKWLAAAFTAQPKSPKQKISPFFGNTKKEGISPVRNCSGDLIYTGKSSMPGCLGGGLPAVSGDIFLSGRLADFPFDHQNGQFSVRTRITDMGLHVAAGMPDFQIASGSVGFAGRNMLATLVGVQVSDIRLAAVSAAISGIGQPAARLVVSGKAGLPHGKALPVVFSATLGAAGLSDARFRYGSLSGQLRFPGAGITAIHFPRLDMPFSATKGSLSFKPNQIPALDITAESVWYGKKRLGSLQLALRPVTDGARITGLSLDSPLFHLDSEGAWLTGGTHFQGKLQTARTSEFLSLFGQKVENLAAGKGTLAFDLSWPGDPTAFSLKNLSGTLSLWLGRGRITHLDRETSNRLDLGRMLNVFSLQTLPRRLSLDFSDLFEEGYGFDSVQGVFELQNGNALTRSATLKGIVAQIEVSGRFGLVARDYDLRLSITPNVTSSLPVVAAVAVNPIVGLAALIAEKMTNREVSRMTGYHYLITGPWTHPVWQKISE